MLEPKVVRIGEKPIAQKRKQRTTVYLSQFQIWEVDEEVKKGLLGSSRSEVIRYLLISALHRIHRPTND